MTGGRAASVATVRLSYADCDPAGILYYAAWFELMERTLSSWFFDAGFRFDTMAAELGGAPVTRSTWCDYLAPATVYDLVRVEMDVAAVGARSYRLEFTMTREPDEVVLARSGIGCVFVGRDGTAAPLPDPFRTVLEVARRHS